MSAILQILSSLGGIPVSSSLIGTPFGTISFGSDPSIDYNKAFDGNTANFFASNANDGTAYAGLDLGSAKTVTKIRVYPRSAFVTGRISNTDIEGSNTSSSSGYTNIGNMGTVTAATWNEITITGSYRYVRLKQNAADYLDVAEIEFWGY